jgi:adenylate cyclase
LPVCTKVSGGFPAGHCPARLNHTIAAIVLDNWENGAMTGLGIDKTETGRVRRQVQVTSIAANCAGALIVFALLTFVLPPPPNLGHATRVIAINAAVLAVSLAVGLPLGSTILQRLWRLQTAWVAEDRDPTEPERERTLRFPLTLQMVIGALWAADAVLFALVNVFVSAELALSVTLTIVLGGLVTCALGYLLSERQLRPIAALTLATGLPARPQLPGVAARTLLSWTLGAGVALLGLVLVGVTSLIDGRFTPTQLAVVMIVLGATGLAVGWASMIGLARSLSGPVGDLRAAVARVQDGDFDAEVTVDDGSEVGLLQAGFNRMLAGLREREEMRDLFGRQVGEDVVRHALEHGVELGGEAREAAVLFVDLQGSTQLAAERDPAEVVALLNRFFHLVVDVVDAHDGWVNKFEGDAALCVFGAPLTDEACASHALAAGRRLAARLCDELPDIRAGIGISAGRMVAGNLGAARRFEYTVIGDPVNEAARLSDLAKSEDGRVLASKAALDKAGEESSRWQIRGEQELRGRPEPTVVAIPAGAGADEKAA